MFHFCLQSHFKQELSKIQSNLQYNHLAKVTTQPQINKLKVTSSRKVLIQFKKEISWKKNLSVIMKIQKRKVAKQGDMRKVDNNVECKFIFDSGMNSWNESIEDIEEEL